MSPVGRPKKNNYPDYMMADRRRGGFIVRNPLTKKEKRFADEAQAREAAELLGELVRQERRERLLAGGKPTIANLVTWWERDRLPLMPWDEGTRRAVLWKMRRVSRDLGDRTIERTDRLFLDDWLCSFCRTADQFNKWRWALVLLWRFAVARSLAQANEAEALEKRSTSKKIVANRKVRSQLDVEGFKLIHGAAPPWLQIAMELSLITLQARTEICNMQHPHFRGDYLYVIRDKTSAESDMAFIKIALTEELEELQRRSRTLDGIVSPYLVHRAPHRRRREWTEGKPHWTYVNPEYLSKAFAEVRDPIDRFKAMPARERPTFHEIRGLGSRLYEAAGVSREAIQALMTHSNPRTTQIYLERGAAALTDSDFHPVTATLSAREILK